MTAEEKQEVELAAFVGRFQKASDGRKKALRKALKVAGKKKGGKLHKALGRLHVEIKTCEIFNAELDQVKERKFTAGSAQADVHKFSGEVLFPRVQGMSARLPPRRLRMRFPGCWRRRSCAATGLRRRSSGS